MEIQLAHFDFERYTSFREASTFKNGVVMLAFQFAISTEDNPKFNFLCEQSQRVQKAGESVKLSLQDLPNVKALIPGTDEKEFFFYHGSLTRPPCSNTVTWVIPTSKVEISSSQVSTQHQYWNNT